jgi:hypothetical protein
VVGGKARNARWLSLEQEPFHGSFVLNSSAIVFVEDFSLRLTLAPTQLITMEKYPEKEYHLHKLVD